MPDALYIDLRNYEAHPLNMGEQSVESLQENQETLSR
jgi:hypothetical protein